jgi:transcriptional regulator with XRE-family HTH domain
MEGTRATDLISALERSRQKDGLNQGELANQLGIGQSHLSRLLSGKVNSSNKLMHRIEAYLAGRHVSPTKPLPIWAEEIINLAEASPEFRDLLLAALKVGLIYEVWPLRDCQ